MTSENISEVLAIQAAMVADLPADQRARYDAELARCAPAPEGYVNCQACGWMHPAGQACALVAPLPAAVERACYLTELAMGGAR